MSCKNDEVGLGTDGEFRDDQRKSTPLKKLLSKAITGLMMIGISFNIEARVTKEVAEATIPYLLEVVGIPRAQQINAQKEAIVHMIYTDAGNSELVNWVVEGYFPGRLSSIFSPLIIPRQLTTGGQKSRLQVLFPCQTTHTFTSYASNASKLGFHILGTAGTLENACNAMFSRNTTTWNVENTVSNATSIYGNAGADALYSIMSAKLGAVLFTLDICDTDVQIKNILDQVIGGDAGARNTAINAAITVAVVSNEYNHRPVSATSIPNPTTPMQRVGDCVQTLYRHLINIAVQNNNANPMEYNIGHLDEHLREYYTESGLTLANHIVTIPATRAEAGLMNLAFHQRWAGKLAVVTNVGDITNGAINDIVRVLTHVCPLDEENNPNMGTSSLAQRDAEFEYPGAALTHTITATEDPHGYANSIRDALNALDGRCTNADNNNRRFLVRITNNMEDAGLEHVRLPHNTNIVIEILDKLWNRRIIIGARAAETPNAHAEIASIIQHQLQ